MYVLAVCLIGGFCLSLRSLQSKKLGNVFHNRIKICFVFFITGHIIRIKLCIGNFLVADVCKEGIIICSCKTDRHTAGFMISCYKNQSLVRMFIIKLYRFSNCIVHSHSICNGSCRIIGMAGPVDFSAFYHHKEACVIIQNLNAFFHIICKRPFAFHTVHIIAHGIVICQSLVNDNCFSVFCCQRLCLSLSFYYFIACFLCQLIEISLVSVLSGRLFQTAACKIIKFTGDHFLSDFIVIVSGCLMSVKSCRGSMIEIYCGKNSHLIAKLFFQLFCNSLIGSFHFLIHINGSAVGFMSGRNRGCCGCGIRTERGAVIGLC